LSNTPKYSKKSAVPIKITQITHTINNITQLCLIFNSRQHKIGGNSLMRNSPVSTLNMHSAIINHHQIHIQVSTLNTRSAIINHHKIHTLVHK
jgi:hypothetical protein